ncbi:hypothetical protein FA13DRAFT_1158659 [Coprinellus micaceus]|uniref:Uncharacterized protein n=1 Tax=Coprinellus micaceus TaxID=71717 RepID=A0A4Y7SUH4_COPMI|nr:hypothetical protein FA13DRAFT_1158659 [Coprinellus micaceus]
MDSPHLRIDSGPGPRSPGSPLLAAGRLDEPFTAHARSRARRLCQPPSLLESSLSPHLPSHLRPLNLPVHRRLEGLGVIRLKEPTAGRCGFEIEEPQRIWLDFHFLSDMFATISPPGRPSPAGKTRSRVSCTRTRENDDLHGPGFERKGSKASPSSILTSFPRLSDEAANDILHFGMQAAVILNLVQRRLGRIDVLHTEPLPWHAHRWNVCAQRAPKERLSNSP